MHTRRMSSYYECHERDCARFQSQMSLSWKYWPDWDRQQLRLTQFPASTRGKTHGKSTLTSREMDLRCLSPTQATPRECELHLE